MTIVTIIVVAVGAASTVQSAYRVIAAERDEGGTRIVSGDVALAPLTVGDYLLETAVTRGTTTRVALAAFRIIP